MNIKSELLDLLVKYGMTGDEITELASRLVLDGAHYENAKVNAQRLLEQNDDVRKGLLATLADAEAKAARSRKILSFIVDPGDEAAADDQPI